MPSVFYEQRSENLSTGPICDHPFPSHVHDPVEIVCPTFGTLVMTISGKQYQLIPGDIAVVFPSVPHSLDFVSPDINGVTLISCQTPLASTAAPSAPCCPPAPC